MPGFFLGQIEISFVLNNVRNIRNRIANFQGA